MDDLQFRRTIYADPNCTDEAVKKAAQEDASKQEFWDELKLLESKVQAASKVEVPENLAHRLILRQSIQSHAKRKARHRWQLAVAASLFFVFGVSFTLWQQQGIDLGEHALAHVYHEADGFALKVDGDVSLDEVNSRLVGLGISLTEDVGRVYFAHHCNFDKVGSFHMVFEGDEGKVTVFLVPKKDNHRATGQFADDRMYGETVPLKNANMILVSDNGKSFSKLKSNLQKSLLFSA